jgi:hypothetical protein
MDAVSASNLLGYITAFIIIVAFFAVVRILYRFPSKPETPIAPQPQVTPQPIPQTLTTTPPLLELVAAAVAGAHQYLRSKARKTTPMPAGALSQKQFFINYWVLSERLNPHFREDPFHREKTR